MTVTKKCYQCDADGIVHVENNKWLCAEHIIERIHLAHNVTMTEADQEMADFCNSDSKLS